MNLSGKTALIIGAAGTGNMGQVISRRLAKEGVEVCIAGRNQGPLKDLTSEIGGSYILCDITDKTAVSTMVESAAKSMGKIDIAINATGWGLTQAFQKTTEYDLDKMLALQFKGPYFFMQSLIPIMKASGGGSIIQISSGTAVLATMNHNAYAGTKAGIDHVVRGLANEFGKYNIRINSISPGFTNTPMTADSMAIAGVEEAFIPSYPLGRLGTSDDIAAMCVFLASDECFMTGQNLQVNGGLTLRRNPTSHEIAASIKAAKES